MSAHSGVSCPLLNKEVEVFERVGASVDACTAIRTYARQLHSAGRPGIEVLGGAAMACLERAARASDMRPVLFEEQLRQMEDETGYPVDPREEYLLASIEAFRAADETRHTDEGPLIPYGPFPRLEFQPVVGDRVVGTVTWSHGSLFEGAPNFKKPKLSFDFPPIALDGNSILDAELRRNLMQGFIKRNLVKQSAASWQE